ncbi:unnamed protein product [Oppiella nova]|uniref:NR LBD domain-containing protein n=1 Tax=Oppiella nova TaxID=334625 RepID=A0A7R9MAP1_9ACAR|nr:unnamed protein product [Oppiella nova]CAG2173636.1 unnamed protein product [Oppiella nova]
MNRLKQLFTSTAYMRDPVVKITSKVDTYTDVYKVFQMRSDTKSRRVIQMCKTMAQFKELCEDDKIILLKASCPEIICLISVTTFDFESEFWTVATDSENGVMLPLNVLKWGKWNFYDILKQFMITIKGEYDSDMNLIDLLMAIILFNPNRPNLKHKEIVKLQQKTYMYLLQRYLEIKHNSKSESETRFLRLMNCLNELYLTTHNMMSNAYIFSDEQKRKRKAIVEENRSKTKVNIKLNAIHSSNTSSQTQSDSDINDISMNESNYVDNDSADNLQNRLKFNEIEKRFDEEMPVVSMINEINSYDKCLNDIEMNRLAELLNATQKIRDPVSKITCLATKHPEVRHTMAVKWEQFPFHCHSVSHLWMFSGQTCYFADRIPDLLGRIQQFCQTIHFYFIQTLVV